MLLSLKLFDFSFVISNWAQSCTDIDEENVHKCAVSKADTSRRNERNLIYLYLLRDFPMARQHIHA